MNDILALPEDRSWTVGAEATLEEVRAWGGKRLWKTAKSEAGWGLFAGSRWDDLTNWNAGARFEIRF